MTGHHEQEGRRPRLATYAGESLGPGIAPADLGVQQRLAEAQSQRSRHARRSGQRRMLRAALMLTLSVLAIVLILGGVYTTALRSRLAVYAGELAEQDAARARAEQELAALRSERDALALGRLPGLVPLELDRAIAIEQQYLRNVIFTQTGVGGAGTFEYRMVMHNPGAEVLLPAVLMVLFDERGFQIGQSDVARAAIGAGTGPAAWLQPGETRSYTASLPLLPGARPRYFLLILD